MVEKVKKINYKNVSGFEELRDIQKAKLICLNEGISRFRTIHTLDYQRLNKIIEDLELENDLRPYDRKSEKAIGIVYIDKSIRKSTEEMLEREKTQETEVELYKLEGFPECCAREHVYHKKLENKIPEEEIVPEKFENFHLEAAEMLERGGEIPEEYLYVVRDSDDPVPCEFGCESWRELGKKSKEILEESGEERLTNKLKRKNKNEFNYHIKTFKNWRAERENCNEILEKNISKTKDKIKQN